MINRIENHNIKCEKYSVYDYDDLTLQELLCKFFTKINECIDISNESFNLMDWIKKEGLPEEVGKLLLQWYEDGTLGDIINEELFTSILFYPTLPHEQGVVYEKYPYGDVRRFGAIGDGSTDNTKAFKNCIKSLGGIWADKSNTMYIPSGAWNYSEPIIIDRDNLTIKGDGIEQTILKPQDCDGIRCEGNIGNTRYGVVLKDFAINGGKTGINASYLALNCKVSNISIHSVKEIGFYCNNGFDFLIEYLVVRDSGKVGIFLDQTEETDSSSYAEMSYITLNSCMAINCNNNGTQWKISGNNMYLNDCKANEGNLGIEFVGNTWACRVKNFYMDGKGAESTMFKINSVSARNITFDSVYGWNLGTIIHAVQGVSIIGSNLDVNPSNWEYTVLKVDEGYNGVVQLDGKNYKIEDSRPTNLPFLYFGDFAETPGLKFLTKEVSIRMYAGGEKYMSEFFAVNELGIQQVFVTPKEDISYIARDGAFADQVVQPSLYTTNNGEGYFSVNIDCHHIVKTEKTVKLQVLVVMKPQKPFQ